MANEAILQDDSERQSLPPELEFVRIYVLYHPIPVRLDVAARLVTLLGRWWRPRWVEFTDIHGRLMRVRTRDIERFESSSQESRTSAEVLDYRAYRDRQRLHRRLDRAYYNDEWED